MASAPTGVAIARDRGRRSRRRRGRGRGFPDSKYASADASRPVRFQDAAPATEPSVVSASPVPEFEPRPSPVSAGGTDFSVLPGESLAKYTRSNIQPLDEAEEDEIRDLQETTVVPQSEPLAEIAEEAVEEPDDAPVAEESEILAVEPDIEIIVTAESFVEEPAEEIEVSELEGDSETEVEPAGTESAVSGDEPTPSEATPPLSAQVREQGGRFPHRMPRRMRRKMRGSGQGESRPAESRQAEPRPDEERRPDVTSAEPSEKPAFRPDQRTYSRPEKAPLPSITELLKEGQEIIVQIAKEPLGQKGARITSHIALPGRYVVYMPTLEHTGVSRKIASDDERLRLKRILQIHHAGIPGGFIVRTAGEGKSEEDLAADMNFLFNLWLDIRQKAEKKPAPLLLHHDLDIVQRTLRDQFTDDFKAIWVDNEELYESVLRFVQRFQPSLVTRVKLYTRPDPIFDAFNITAELEKALRPKVWLKSGGYIVINQTEALVAIDVNTGKYVGRSNRLEDTIVKTNTEAVKEIVRQVRLRDLGGIIVVDFIDMDERKNRQKVMQALERRHAHRPRALQDSAVQRFWLGGHHAQACQAKPGTRALHALPALRRRGLREKRADHRERDSAGSRQNRRRHRRQGCAAAGASRCRKIPQVEPEQTSGRARRNSAPARAGESGPTAAPREVRLRLIAGGTPR